MLGKQATTRWAVQAALGLVLAWPGARPSAAQDQDFQLSAPRMQPSEQRRPNFLQRPLDSAPPSPPVPDPSLDDSPPFLVTPFDQPTGFAGPSSVEPREDQSSSHFLPVEDRWRVGFPLWDRYDKGHPCLNDYPYVLGQLLDPYNLNVLKGDYPIVGQHTFLDITATNFTFTEVRQLPTPTTPFESTSRPFQEEFFGRPNQLFFTNCLQVSFDLFHGDAAFKPVDWRVKLTPVFNVNYIDVNELAVVNPNVLDGRIRARTFSTLQEYFAEAKLTDLSPDYDFMSLRVGSQPFVSDFRGFLFADINRAIRLFGTQFSNRDQFNLIYFRQAEKDTNSALNTFRDRGQNIAIANYYRQDFIWPGYTAQVSLHYNNDPSSFFFDKNDFLVRPAAMGVFQPHNLNVGYVGWAGDGHINRYNVTHQLYWAFGHDGLNPLANRPQEISAWMGAIELSYDRDWARFRTSFFYASGDDNVNNSHGCGFDTILDNPNFVGGEFSYWQRQAIGLFSVNLTNRGSLLADLRSSKIQGQSNFVNPGIQILNFGIDMDLTPKLKWINNLNSLWFGQVNPLQVFVFQQRMRRYIGEDISTGIEYRPLLNNNIILVMGLSGLAPGEGFEDLYDKLMRKAPPLVAGFMSLELTY